MTHPKFRHMLTGLPLSFLQDSSLVSSPWISFFLPCFLNFPKPIQAICFLLYIFAWALPIFRFQTSRKCLRSVKSRYLNESHHDQDPDRLPAWEKNTRVGVLPDGISILQILQLQKERSLWAFCPPGREKNVWYPASPRQSKESEPNLSGDDGLSLLPSPSPRLALGCWASHSTCGSPSRSSDKSWAHQLALVPTGQSSVIERWRTGRLKGPRHEPGTGEDISRASAAVPRPLVSAK